MNTQLDMQKFLPTRWSRVLLIAGIVILALNLRPSLTAIGSLVGLIQKDTGLSNMAVGFLTTLPMLVLSVFSILAPIVAIKYGLRNVLFASLIVLAIGILFRVYTPVYALFIGTFLIGVAIAMGNVLLPSLVKHEFPRQTGLMTGVYSTLYNLGAGLGSGISVPLAISLGLGWRGSLMSWVLIAIIGIIIWIPLLRQSSDHSQIHSPSVGSGMLKSWLAWQVTLYLGIQSFTFYSTVAWFPQMLQDWGMDASTAGWVYSLVLFFSIPFSFLTPVIAGKMKNQQILVLIASTCTLLTLFGMLFFKTKWAVLWMTFLAIGIGIAFSLALSLIVFRTANAVQAAELSGMSQSVGYFLTAVGPLFFGLLHDLTASWTSTLVILIVLNIFHCLIGLGASRDRIIKVHENVI